MPRATPLIPPTPACPACARLAAEATRLDKRLAAQAKQLREADARARALTAELDKAHALVAKLRYEADWMRFQEPFIALQFGRNLPGEGRILNAVFHLN